MALRKYALIESPLKNAFTRHFVGCPPSIASDDIRRVLPNANVILLRESPEGGVTLVRYSIHQEFAGDTWHPDMEEALEQVAFEYPNILGQWKDIPSEVSDNPEDTMDWLATLNLYNGPE